MLPSGRYAHSMWQVVRNGHMNAEQKRIVFAGPQGHPLLKGVAGSGKPLSTSYRIKVKRRSAGDHPKQLGATHADHGVLNAAPKKQ